MEKKNVDEFKLLRIKCVLVTSKMFNSSSNRSNHFLIAHAYYRIATPRQLEFHLTDFYRHLPPDIPREDWLGILSTA